MDLDIDLLAECNLPKVKLISNLYMIRMDSFVGGLFIETLRKSDMAGEGDASKSVHN